VCAARTGQSVAASACHIHQWCSQGAGDLDDQVLGHLVGLGRLDPVAHPCHDRLEDLDDVADGVVGVDPGDRRLGEGAALQRRAASVGQHADRGGPLGGGVLLGHQAQVDQADDGALQRLAGDLLRVLGQGALDDGHVLLLLGRTSRPIHDQRGTTRAVSAGEGRVASFTIMIGHRRRPLAGTAAPQWGP
jgi:hypothetical protein